MVFKIQWPLSGISHSRSASGEAAGSSGRGHSTINSKGFRVSSGQAVDPDDEGNMLKHVLSGSFARTVAQACGQTRIPAP